MDTHPLRKNTHMARPQHTVLVKSFHAPFLFHGQARLSCKKQCMSHFSQLQQPGDTGSHKHAGGPQNRVGVTIVALFFAARLHHHLLPWLTLDKRVVVSVSHWQFSERHRRSWKHWRHRSLEMPIRSWATSKTWHDGAFGMLC